MTWNMIDQNNGSYESWRLSKGAYGTICHLNQGKSGITKCKKNSYIDMHAKDYSRFISCF